MELRQICLSGIRLGDTRFRFTLDKPDEKLMVSIQEAGIVEPVIIKAKDNAFILVTGWRRVEAAHASGLKEVPALVLPSELTDLDIFRLAFFESYAQKDFSLAEKALIINKFIDFGLGQEELIRKLLPLLALPPERKTTDLLDQLAGLDWALPAIHRCRWKLPTARLFLSFTHEEQKLIISLTDAFNHNQQAEFIELLFTLKKRHRMGIEAILSDREMEQLVRKAKEGKPQAGQELLAALKKRVSPLVTKINREIQLAVKEINLPDKCWLDYDHSLEQKSISISLEARSAEELDLALKDLGQSLKAGEWDFLFRQLSKKIDE
ncbi:MAG TPA: ParB/RepB/Spo0J family partition protein [Candidatus Saccharicenans sp.]|mgnify:CR=1|jgi:ParB-like chromosome segregation protein Spo0J|nr:ParB-like nuclease domain-containing protein [Candidatus Saccharicenans sp.]HRD02674.1 ParB/RepB/Spo0J family partition protein [Candidatus Saccharicenans sp.]